jgi:hypothetical protein
MRYLIDHRGARASCLGALLLSLNLIAACAQEQSASVPSGGGGSQSVGGSNGTGAPGGSTGTGVGTGLGGSTGGGASSGSAASSGSGATTGSGASTGVGTGTGATGGDGSDTSGAGASSADGSGSGGVGPGTGGSSRSGTGGSGAGAKGGAGASGAAGIGGGGTSASGCAGKTYKLCEDFETGMVGAIPTGWTAFQGYGKGGTTDVGLASDQFHSGSMALKSDSATTGQKRVQKSLAGIGATASKHWGRIFYKVQSPAAKNPSGVLHVTFVGLDGNGENRVVDIVEANNGTHQWLYNNPNDKGSLGSAYSWSFDTAWHCAEWYVDVSSNSYRFFTDGTEVKTIGFMNKTDSQMSNYSSIIVGATFYQTPNAPFIMWFDDLAIDDNQIGCQ